MKVESLFNINNLVRHKFEQHGKNMIHALEILEIIIQTCYGGTQVFYYCRPIMAKKDFGTHFPKDDTPFEWKISHGLSEKDFEIGWKKYREDELVSLSKEEINVFLNT